MNTKQVSKNVIKIISYLAYTWTHSLTRTALEFIIPQPQSSNKLLIKDIVILTVNIIFKQWYNIHMNILVVLFLESFFRRYFLIKRNEDSFLYICQ